MKSKRLKGFGQIEKEFFDIDGETATVCLHFESLNDVFDVNCLSKTPIFNDDFDEWLQSAFQTIPVKYKVALEITFDDLGGYTQEELNDIFRKNLLLSGRTLAQSIRARDHVAIGLLAAGLFSFVAMVVIGRLWAEESFWHEVFFYFLDIATTVLFWEAAGILLVENREQRLIAVSYRERLSGIVFYETKGSACGKSERPQGK